MTSLLAASSSKNCSFRPNLNRTPWEQGALRPEFDHNGSADITFIKCGCHRTHCARLENAMFWAAAFCGSLGSVQPAAGCSNRRRPLTRLQNSLKFNTPKP
ncbi:hypothetical protein Tcan_01063, partial [Toxocara canis]